MPFRAFRRPARPPLHRLVGEVVAVAIIPLYRDILHTLSACPEGHSVWPVFEEQVYDPHRAYFEGLVETYGEEVFGPGGLSGALERAAPALRQALAPAPAYGIEREAQSLLEAVSPMLPGSPPNIYLGTLLFIAPAATLSVLGRPAIALGLERFHPSPPAGGSKYWYHPAELPEMIPHEAAHAARMQVLKLPPTPRRLTLLDMIMLEGTALTFTDQLVHRQTLATFMDPQRLAWHQAHDGYVRARAAMEFGTHGMEAFLKYFAADSPVSGYYVGYSLCREYLDRFGAGAMRELIAMPSAQIISRLFSSGAPQ